MLTLATPLWLLALPLPWLAWWWGRHRPRADFDAAPHALLHPQAHTLAQWLAAAPPPRPAVPLAWLIGLSLLLLAAARPVWLESASDTYSGRDFMLAIDTSDSMRTLDGSDEGTQPVSRLERLKEVVNAFLAARHGDRVGVVVFGDDAYTLVPVSTDMNLVRTLIGELRHGLAGERTALAAAILLGAERLAARDAQARVLIVLTDGSDTVPGVISPLAAARQAAAQGVRVYTVGIGSQGAAFFPRGTREAPALTTALPLDEETLRAIAQASGGRYYPVAHAVQVGQIIADIENIERLERPQDIARRGVEIYRLPLLLGVGLMMMALWRGRTQALPA